MPLRSNFRIVWTALLAAVAGVGIAWADEPANTPRPPFDPDYVAAHLRQGSFSNPTSACYQCHSSDKSSDNQQDFEAAGVLRRVTTTELGEWKFRDYHSQDYRAVEKEPRQGILGGPRAQAIGKLLYGQDTDLTADLRCVSCHSGHYRIAAAGTEDAPPVLAELEGSLQNVKHHGVSCQACHGPALKWDPLHRQLDDWWKKPSVEKYAVGLLDVRHPVTRAQICLSCHLGSSREGKVLTHEMYAAGHPPLANFEIESFIAAMPTHALPLAKKRQASPDAYRDWWRPTELGEHYRTRSVLTASLVALRMQVQLLADAARWSDGGRADPSGSASEPQWPELALYDCAACHHELDAGRPRQTFATTSVPGRPAMRTWPTALYRVVAKSADSLTPLDEALASRPFGNSRQVAAAADRVIQSLDADLAQLAERKIDRDAAFAYLRTISEHLEAADYEEARQLVAAARVIFDELQTSPGGGASPASAAPVPIDAALSRFVDPLCLTLTLKGDPTAADRTPSAVGAESLHAAFRFPSLEFQRAAAELKRAVSTPPP